MRPVDVIRKVAPHARPEYVKAFEDGDGLFAAAKVTTPLRLAHFLAQILEETGGETIDVESGNYTAAREEVVWPSRFHTLAEAQRFAHNPQALFNNVYANRMGNGPPESGDGYKYRGRGLLQTTGKAAYAKYGKRCGVDFVGNPDLIFDPRYALMPALAEWTDSGCNALADRDDIHTITGRVNGGYTNFAERVRWLHVVKPVIGGSVQLTPVPAYMEPLPKPAPKPPSHVDHVGAIGGLGAALIAAWHSLGHLPWPAIAAIVTVGIAAFVYFVRGKSA